MPIFWYNSEICDVVIFDEVGSEELLECIPSHLRVKILKVRKGRPLIHSLSFFFKSVVNLFKYKNIAIAQYVSIFSIWSPKLLITYIDNSVVPGILQEIFPNISVLSIQNGFRGDFSQNTISNSFGHYFSFGEMELDLIERKKFKYNEIHQIGSLRAGLVAKKKKNNWPELFEICFISEFVARDELCAPQDLWSRDLLKNIESQEDKLFMLAVQFSEFKNQKICVAMRNGVNDQYFIEEYDFFSKLSHNKATIIPRSGLSSYDAAMSSRLVVCLFSTLGYEVLGLGKRVIFAADCENIADFFMGQSWDVNYATHKLPDLQRLYEINYSDFSNKATALLEMDDDKYYGYSASARKYYMNINYENPPQKVINDFIVEKFKRDEI